VRVEKDVHGLIARSLERFVSDTYGAGVWARVSERAHLPDGGFESMLSYPETLFDRALDAASRELGKTCPAILEDMGTFLISHPQLPALRRLLRFSGASFTDFLDMLETLPDRARLAVPALDIPSLELTPLSGGRYRIDYAWHRADGIHVIAGILRALADDYGTLAFTDTVQPPDGVPCLEVSVLDRRFSEGRDFNLGAAS
jgi:hypothetical protein